MNFRPEHTFCWDFEAPTLGAEPVVKDGNLQQYRVWCEFCQKHHLHVPKNGHCEAPCESDLSPYRASGYNLQCDIH